MFIYKFVSEYTFSSIDELSILTFRSLLGLRGVDHLPVCLIPYSYID